MLVDVGVKFFRSPLVFVDEVEKEVNEWLASNRHLYISDIRYQVDYDHLLVFVTYGKEKEKE